jgi:ribonucleoside-diphosphate reductase alpha chain
MRMLDNVIDLNFYPSSRAKASNLKHRPVGLGLMGETEAKVACGVAFDSEEGVRFSDAAMEYISYFAIEASCDMARERGAYKSFDGSKWSKGLLPIHTARSNESVLGMATWNQLAEKVMGFGMRNSNCMAIAPTATISIITGTTPCIEPIFEIERGEKNISGQFKVVDPCVRYRRPDLLKTVWEIDPIWILKSAAMRQKWIDQSQSVNIFVRQGTKGKDLAEIYMTAWKMGLKTTYYLRGQSKIKTVEKPKEVLAPVETEQPGFCSIDNPDCESCQ